MTKGMTNEQKKLWNKVLDMKEKDVVEIIVEDAEKGIYTWIDKDDNRTTYDKDGEILHVSFGFINNKFREMGLL